MLFRSPRGPYDVLISKINKFRNILSVDIPSGFMTSKSVFPSQTVTFHDTKIGMNENNCGKIVKIDIGIKAQIDEKCGPGELLLFPKLVSGRHKGENGKVAIVGGGEFAGAPSFAGLASYRVGVDLVHLFVPSVSYPQVSSFAPELLVHEINSNVITTDIIPQLKSYNAQYLKFNFVKKFLLKIDFTSITTPLGLKIFRHLSSEKLMYSL